jgi:hypothetical protein
VDYRGLYQVPREEYLAELDELVGEGSAGEEGDRNEGSDGTTADAPGTGEEG